MAAYLTGGTRHLIGTIEANTPGASVLYAGGPDYINTSGAEASASLILVVPSDGYVGGYVISTESTSNGGENFETGIVQYTHTITVVLASGTFNATTGLCDSSSATFTFSLPTQFSDETVECALGGFSPYASSTYEEATEAFVAGQTWSIGVTAGSTSASNSGTFTTADPEWMFLDPTSSYTGILYGACAGQPSSGLGPGSSSVSINASLNGSPLEWAGNTTFSPNGYPIVVDYSSGVSVSSEDGLGGGAGQTLAFYFGGLLSVQFPTSWDLTGNAYQLDTAYPSALNYWAVMDNHTNGSTPNPTVALTGAPSGYPVFPWQTTAQTVVHNLAYSPEVISTIYEQPYYLAGIAVYADETSLVAAGEPARAYQLFLDISKKPYDALSVAIANPYVFDNLTQPGIWYPDFTGMQPAGYPNVTAPSSGVLEFDLSMDSFGNPVTQTWIRGAYPTPEVGTPVSAQVVGYRYLTFQIRSMTTADELFTVQLSDLMGTGTPDKFWSCMTGAAGTWVTVTIDMCAPNSGGPSNPNDIQQDSQLPDIWMFNSWGVGQLSQIRLNFGSTAEQYQIQNLNFKYVNTPSWSCLSETQPVIDGNLPSGYMWPDTKTRIATIDVDGRRIELADYPLLSGTGGIYQIDYAYGLSDLATQITAIGGWTATVIPSAATWNISTLAADIGGNGQIVGSQNWIENSFASGTIQGQMRVTWLTCPPNCGDILGSGGGTGIVPVPVTLRIRGAFTGLTLDPSGQPEAGQTVTVKQGIYSRGTATSNSEARYMEPAVYPVSAVATVASGGAGVMLNSGDRLIRRCCTTVLPQYTPLAYDRSLPFRHARVNAHADSSHLWVSFSPNGNPYNWGAEIDTGIVSANARIRWQDNGQGPLGILYDSGSNLLWTLTPDEGHTYTSPMNIATNLATNGFYDYEEAGDFVRWFFWEVGTSAPYTIWSALLDSQKNVIRSPQATNITNADLLPIAIREYPVGGGGRSIGILYSSAGTLIFLTSRDGLNFS